MYIEEDLSMYDRVLTFEDVLKEVREERDNMSEEEEFCRLRDNDPTFIEWCWSVMHCNKWNKALINVHTYKCEKVTEDK